MMMGTDMPDVGAALPEWRKGPISQQQLVEWCAAENDYNPIHYERAKAEAIGLKGMPIQGTLRFALLAQYVRRVAPPGWKLRRIACRYVGLALVNDSLLMRGVVTVSAGDRLAIAIHAENQDGTKVIAGEAELTPRG